MNKIFLSSIKKNIDAVINLPASKSISNRVLIIHALCAKNFGINNLSEADDTKTLQYCLNSNEALLNAGDGGTTLRFLLAYRALKGKPVNLTASERMMLRPLEPMIDALNSLGANIELTKQSPATIIKINPSKMTGSEVEIDASISSQFVSALLLISPYLENGLTIKLKGEEVSAPYTEMTISLMKHFGVEVNRNNNFITVSNRSYQPKEFSVESDWSAGSYWYAIAALSDKATIFLPNLFQNSLQGDSVIAALMNSFDVKTNFEKDGVRISKQANFNFPTSFEMDFLNTPDIFQTVCVLCAALNIPSQFTGLQTLKHKETDRLLAMETELKKMGAVVKAEDNSFEIIKGINLNSEINVSTYNDHRMAMAFAPLALIIKNVMIENADVVHKSYPGFWNDLNKLA